MKLLITENQLSKLRNYLTEISVQDAYAQYYTDISKEDFDKIIAADPFTRPNFLSSYSKWLLGLYKNRNLKLEDLYKATEYIKVFDKVKSRLPIDKRDIGKFKSLPDMFVVIQPYVESGEEIQSNTSLEKEIKQKEVKRLFEDSKWLVIQPLTERAACYYGKNTQWCTAGDENNYFDYYNERGDLYINIDKVNNRKYQFHFEESQFMDENDRDIDLFYLLNNNPTLKTFYNNFLKDKVKDMRFHDLVINDTGCYILTNNWSNFSNAFEKNRNQKNPADFLNNLDDEYYDYDFSRDSLSSYFDYINQSNLQFMVDFLIKDGRLTEDSDDDEIQEAILDDDEFESAIERALTWAKADADRNAIYDDITGEIRKHYDVSEITYTDKGIVLKLRTCPEPVLLYATNDEGFIDGYTNIYGKIDYRYDGYYDEEPDRKLFNEYLSDNLQ